MPTDDIIELALVFSLVVVPALGITARIVLKPLVDAIVRLKEASVLPSVGGARMESDVLQLRDEVRSMRDEMSQLHASISGLSEADAFNRALREPAPPQLPPGGE